MVGTVWYHSSPTVLDSDGETRIGKLEEEGAQWRDGTEVASSTFRKEKERKRSRAEAGIRHR